MRLGDLDRIAQDVRENNAENYDKQDWTSRQVVTLLENAPTISAVPVVRCRECKRWDADPDSYGKDDGPKGKCMKSFEETYDDDFCSYGQRKIETILPKSEVKDEGLEADHEVS